MEHYAIDGTNVCWWNAKMNSETFSIKPLFSIIEAILKNEDDFYCVFDASIYYELEKHNINEIEILTGLVNGFPNHFYIVTAASRADGVVLHNADHYNRRIITNDTFRDYTYKYSWLLDKYTDRLIQGNMQNDGLITVDKLSYGKLSIGENLINQSQYIESILKKKNSLEYISLEQEIIEKQKLLVNLETAIEANKNILSVFDNTEKHHNERLKLLVEEEEAYQTKKEQSKKEYLMLKEEYLMLKEKLNKSGLIFNIEKEYQDRLDKLNEVSKKLKESEAESYRINIENDALRHQYSRYEVELKKARETKQKDQIKLADGKACIMRAQREIWEFLEKYGINDKNHIYFKGSSWEVAVQALEVSFLKKPICEQCYERSSYNGVNCTYCKSANYTKHPKEIWDIINKCAPVVRIKANIEDGISSISDNITRADFNAKEDDINKRIDKSQGKTINRSVRKPKVLAVAFGFNLFKKKKK